MSEPRKEDKGARPWRLGNVAGRTIYDVDGEYVGLMETPKLAQLVVAAVNGQGDPK